MIFDRVNVVLTVFCSAFIVLGINIAGLGALLVSLTAELGTPLAAGGSLFLLRACGAVAGSLAAGAALERAPAAGHRVLAGSLACIAVAGVAAARAPTLTWLASAMSIAGFGEPIKFIYRLIFVCWLWGLATFF